MTRRENMVEVRAIGRRLAAGAAILIALTGAAWSQDYPSRAVRVVVPTNPGGLIDITARIISGKLSEMWGKPVVIENRAGAAMIIGAEAVARSAPDGYTLLITHDGTMTTNQVVYPALSYNPEKDFHPISLLTSVPMVVVVNEALPVRSLQELVAFAKASPGKLNHAAGGTSMLLALELFKAMTGTQIINVPHRGGVAAVTGTIQGETHMSIADLTSVTPAIQSQRVRPLAVTSLTASKSLPGVPTADASGIPGYEVYSWVAAFAPAGTPTPIVQKIEADIKRVLAMPEIRTKLEQANLEPRSGESEEVRKLIVSDTAKWSRLVKENGIKLAQ